MLAHMPGVRATSLTNPFIHWLDDSSLEWYWAECQRLGIPVMTLVPGMVRKLLPVTFRANNFAAVSFLSNCSAAKKGNEWLMIKHQNDAVDPVWNIDEHDGSVLTGRTLDEIAKTKPRSATSQPDAAR